MRLIAIVLHTNANYSYSVLLVENAFFESVQSVKNTDSVLRTTEYGIRITDWVSNRD